MTIKKYYRIVVFANNWGKKERIYETDCFHAYPSEVEMLHTVKQSELVCKDHEGWRREVVIEEWYHVDRN